MYDRVCVFVIPNGNLPTLGNPFFPLAFFLLPPSHTVTITAGQPADNGNTSFELGLREVTSRVRLAHNTTRTATPPETKLT